LIIPAGGEYMPPQRTPPPSTTVGKAIVVSVGTLRIYAFENGELIHSHLVSTGLPQTPTLPGDYSIYVKYLADDMSGPDYFLPQVPYTMYFYAGYALHGTYWHNAFGRPMSHGCVNLPVAGSGGFPLGAGGRRCASSREQRRRRLALSSSLSALQAQRA
jgi:hypothetical protein